MSGGTGGGRPRKPTALKVLNGSAEHHPERVNHDEPQVTPLTQVPDPPAFHVLSERSRGVWNDLCLRAIGIGTLSDADLAVMASTCDAFVEWKTADSWQRAHDAQKMYIAGLGHFGLSPSTRAKVHAPTPPTPSRMSQLLKPRTGTG